MVLELSALFLGIPLALAAASAVALIIARKRGLARRNAIMRRLMES